VPARAPACAWLCAENARTVNAKAPPIVEVSHNIGDATAAHCHIADASIDRAQSSASEDQRSRSVSSPIQDRLVVRQLRELRRCASWVVADTAGPRRCVSRRWNYSVQRSSGSGGSGGGRVALRDNRLCVQFAVACLS